MINVLLIFKALTNKNQYNLLFYLDNSEKIFLYLYKF